jgi:undecaprenyl-diphosphatase
MVTKGAGKSLGVTAADPKQAAQEVLAGQPGEHARAWLGPLTIGLAVAFVVVSVAVGFGQGNGMLLPIDLPVTVAIQAFNWGPLVYVFQAINLSAGLYQGALGVLIVVVLFIWQRRAGYLMVLSALSSLFDNLIKIGMARPRPSVDLVHIIVPATGWSYPSGHVVFFTWVSTMVAFAVAPHISRRWRLVVWTLAAVVIILTMLARVWAGDHWPSDVLGGWLLGMGWSAFVVWLPERWLPSPKFGWFAGRKARVATVKVQSE